MNRRHLLQLAGALSVAAATSRAAAASVRPGRRAADEIPVGDVSARSVPLQPPSRGSIPVAVVVSRGARVVDFCGPWEVFENVSVSGQTAVPFRLYTVADTLTPVTASDGVKIIPNFSFETAPLPRVIVIPGQDASSEPMLDWIRRASRAADVTMAVCAGAFVLARTGLLSGKAATTHDDAYADLETQFPDIRVVRGARWVEAGNLATAGGKFSGVDLSLRVVERYFGRAVAAHTASFMQSEVSSHWLCHKGAADGAPELLRDTV